MAWSTFSPSVAAPDPARHAACRRSDTDTRRGMVIYSFACAVHRERELSRARASQMVPHDGAFDLSCSGGAEELRAARREPHARRGERGSSARALLTARPGLPCISGFSKSDYAILNECGPAAAGGRASTRRPVAHRARDTHTGGPAYPVQTVSQTRRDTVQLYPTRCE